MDKAKLNLVSMSVNFENFQPINNTGFVRGECKVAYAGKNRNYSNIFKEAFEKAQPTVFGIPVVGNWLGDNYGGHDLIIETKGNEVIFKDATVPFGFVPQDANPRWESVEDENGNSKNYYVVDVILWKERYPEQIQFVVDNGANQSMEIMVKDGDWDENWEYFNVNDFYYSALCLLGRETDENGNKGDADVEPCFENSEIITKSFSMTEKFKKDLFAIRSAFEGGESVTVEEKLEDFTDEVVVEDTLETEETFEEEVVEETTEEVTEVTEEKNNFELSHDDIRSKIFDVLNPRDDEGYRTWNYWVMEVFQTYVVVSDETEADKYFKFDYLISEDDEIILSNKIEIFLVWLTQEEKDEVENKDNEFNLLKKEIEKLREYKIARETEIANEQKDSLIGDYSLLLTEEEIEVAIANKDSMTYTEIEINLSKAFAIKSLQNARNKKTDKKDDTVIFEAKTFENNKGKNKFAI